MDSSDGTGHINGETEELLESAKDVADPEVVNSDDPANGDSSDEGTDSPTVQEYSEIANADSKDESLERRVSDEHEGRAENDDESEEGSTEDEDEDADEDEEDDDEYESALKYDVLGGETSKLFERDSASALGVSSKHIVSCMQPPGACIH